jgi:hypothetical protein
MKLQHIWFKQEGIAQWYWASHIKDMSLVTLLACGKEYVILKDIKMQYRQKCYLMIVLM